MVALLRRVSACGFRHLLFAFPREEVRFERRGFPDRDGSVTERLERIGETFHTGYHIALEDDRRDDGALERRLAVIDAEQRGWAYEGAGMALALRDRCPILGRGRWQEFARGVGAPHIHLLHVGAGWAAARLRLRLAPYLERFDPLLRWLVVDGAGFHEGYFRPRAETHAVRLPGYLARAFDQGIGRSLWFSLAAEVEEIRERVLAARPARRADLWSGVGLAAGYAGGIPAAALHALAESAGEDRPSLAQGVVFAAVARERAEFIPAHTELACSLITGTDARGCTRLAVECLDAADGPPDGPPGSGDIPRYERWRREIARRLREARHATR